jgi:hypothetical protein
MSPRFVRPRTDGMHAQAPHQRSMRLSPCHRRLAYSVLALAWLTGILWLVFHYFLNRQGEFGSEPHPLEAWWLRLHGVAAFASLWLGGLLWGLHVRPGLTRPNRRTSGIVLIALFALLVLSGYLLYYAGADWLRDGVRLVHWLVGLFLVLPFLIHSLRARAARQTRSDRKA